MRHRYQQHWWQICHRCQRNRWQTTGMISDCLHFKVNKKMYLLVNSTTQRCPNKIFKIFLIDDFFHFPPVSTTRWCTLSCEYLREFSNKFEIIIILMGYSRAGGKLIHEKNLKSKILWHCPFKAIFSSLWLLVAKLWKCLKRLRLLDFNYKWIVKLLWNRNAINIILCHL